MYECDRECVLTNHYRRHEIVVGGHYMGNNHYRRKAEESKRMYYLGGREEKLATECVYLVQHSMYGARGAAWLVQQWSVQ